MTENPQPGILAQAHAPAGVESVLYTVPKASHCFLQRLIICNTDKANRTFSVALCPRGQLNHPSDWIHFSESLAGNTSFFCELGVRLGPTDSVVAICDGDGISMTFLGQLI
jgi:hypothetical protein